MSLFFEGLPGLQSGVSMGGVDLVGAHSPPRLYLRRSRRLSMSHWRRHGQIGLGVHRRTRVFVLRGVRRVGRVPVGRMVVWTGLRLEDSPVLGGL